MSKATFDDFIAQNPICSRYENDFRAIEVFDILSRDKNIIAMIDANTAGRPALTPCAREVEGHLEEMHGLTSFQITDNFTKQAIGRMVKTILKPFGYVTDRQKDLPKDIEASYFTSATVFKIDPSVKPTLAVRRTIVEIH